jgi:drug/metabolite transporter (DMT)-like permease
MNDIGRLFQAFVAPAIFFSATALFILSINVRLMGIVSRMRQYLHARQEAVKNNRPAEAEACTAQIESMERRAEMVRRTFLLSLVALVGTLVSCLLLGFGLYWRPAALAAAAVFVAAMVALLIGVLYYIREVTVALTSVRQEAIDERFNSPESASDPHDHTLF